MVKKMFTYIRRYQIFLYQALTKKTVAEMLLCPKFLVLSFRVLEFGAVGTILGHEITHGFDTIGRKFDMHGKLKNWWTKTSLKEFMKRIDCIENQYSNFYWEAAGINVSKSNLLMGLSEIEATETPIQ